VAVGLAVGLAVGVGAAVVNGTGGANCAAAVPTRKATKAKDIMMNEGEFQRFQKRAASKVRKRVEQRSTLVITTV